MNKKNNTTKISLAEARKTKGKSNLSKLLAEQAKEKKKIKVESEAFTKKIQPAKK